MPADRVERLQRLERENLERSSAVTARLQRLRTELAVASSDPVLFAGLSRVGQEQSSLAYQRVTEAGIRFIWQMMHLALAHRDDYLAGLPPDRVPAAAPPPMPLPAGEYDPARWIGWYQLFAAWAAEQQARSAIFYRTLADEMAAGRLASDAVRSSAEAFVIARHEGYVVEVAELYAELVSGILDAADGCLDVITAEIRRAPIAPDVTLEVRGPAAGTVITGLLIENAHGQPADVTCLAAPAAEFGLAVSPVAMRLEPGESRRLAVQVTLPAVPSSRPSPAGRVTIRGHGETDLTAEVRARVDLPGELPDPAPPP
jgi:hypothetical protein